MALLKIEYCQGLGMSKLRLIIINLVITAIALGLVLAAGEIYFRTKYPFWEDNVSVQGLFLPSVGFHYEPHTEILHTNHFDFWARNITNSLGFVDREPISKEQYARGCHVAILGDSFVEALQVPIEDKLQVRLDKIAAKQLPALSINTTAWSHSGFGQLNQLRLYDEYVRKLNPKIVVLVFVNNDFANNTSILESLRHGWDPDHPPLLFAEKTKDKIDFLPIDPGWENHLLPTPPTKSALKTQLLYTLQRSWFITWIIEKAALFGVLSIHNNSDKLKLRVDLLSERPQYAHILDGRIPEKMSEIDDMFVQEENLPPIYQDAIDYTAFALDQHKALAERDGYSLVILATHSMRAKNDNLFNHMEKLALDRGIPVIDQYQYIVDAGHNVKDAHWPHDYHWSPMGHQWAAEVLLEYIKKNPNLCNNRLDQFVGIETIDSD